MKASDLIHVRTMKLCEAHPGMEYQDAQEHILRHNPKLKEAYAMDLEVRPSEGGRAYFEEVNPVNQKFIDDVIARARQAKVNGSMDQLRGELGNLIRAGWSKAVSEGPEIGTALERIIAAGHPSAPLAAAELATGQFAQDDPALNTRSCAGITVVERCNTLAEQRLVEGKPELTFSGLLQEVLDSDPQLKADYTGAEV